MEFVRTPPLFVEGEVEQEGTSSVSTDRGAPAGTKELPAVDTIFVGDITCSKGCCGGNFSYG